MAGHTAKIDFDPKNKVFFVKAGKQRIEDSNANRLFKKLRETPGIGRITYSNAASKELKRLNSI